jgi:hypothetical protein
MGRTPHIASNARSTTISLTPAQKASIRKLQTKRLDEDRPEPGLTEVVLEGLKLLFEKEGWSQTELGRVFPKEEIHTATVRVFSKRRRRRPGGLNS